MFIYASACIMLKADEITMRIIDQSANESWKKVSKARIVAPTKVVYFQKFFCTFSKDILFFPLF